MTENLRSHLARTKINIPWETRLRFMAAKLTSLIQTMAILQHFFFGRKLFYLPFSALSVREILDKFSHVLIFSLCVYVEKQPARSPAASFFTFLDHTQLDIHTRYDSSLIAISPSQRPLPTQHPTNTRDENPRPKREWNPRFQQSSGRRPTP